ncbi:hypothetical protein ALQ26_04260 [Pseudomonas amygdali pv. lachrymans]|nr:hypothetical protein ALQ26_04260 [Pseudomonas amygdali pv. lachrymans]
MPVSRCITLASAYAWCSESTGFQAILLLIRSSAHSPPCAELRKVQAAFQFAHDHIDDRQPQPSAIAVALTVEAFKKACFLFLVDTRPCVFD